MKNSYRSCRGCNSNQFEVLIDLGLSPISNSLLVSAEDAKGEVLLPLCVLVCLSCGFCQLSEDATPESHFHSEYVYFSSYSKSWLEHCKKYSDSAINEWAITPEDLVLEVASNDGYLLNYFRNAGIAVLGVEPSRNVADVANANGIPTLVEFFGVECARNLIRDYQKPKLIIGNNVLAHVPDIRDFVEGLSILIANNGVITLEFPHLTQMIANNQFDTIYHEHYSYLSLTALLPIFERFGLRIFRVETLPTHGGSIRIFASLQKDRNDVHQSVTAVLQLEETLDPRNPEVQMNFQKASKKVILDLKAELKLLCSQSKVVVAFGAAAKGNTLLNAAEIDSSLVKLIADSNPSKQGKYAPGSHIPIVSIKTFEEVKFDVALILPWNISSELSSLIRSIHGEKVKILRAVPQLEYI